jgi:hypothetical protein
MSALLGTLLRTVILDNAAYQEWRERPNLFLRGIVLILLVTLLAGIITFAVGLVNNVRPIDAAKIEQGIREGFEQQYKWNPGWQSMDPEARQMMDQMLDVIVPMVVDLVSIESPLPRGIVGFFEALGSWLSRALSAIGGWLFYGALVLIAVNLLGGAAKLPDFLGMVSLYVIPALLGVLAPVPCLGPILGLIGMIWSIVVYIKAVSVATDLDAGRSIVAAVAPLVFFLLLGILLSILWVIWFIIIF